MVTMKSDGEKVYVKTEEGTSPEQLVKDGILITKSTIRLIREKLGDRAADKYVEILQLLLKNDSAETATKKMIALDSKEFGAQLKELLKAKMENERDLEKDNDIE